MVGGPEPLLPGIGSSAVNTGRLKMHTLVSGPTDGDPLVLLHGNVASSRFWEETMLAFSEEYRVIAPDLRGYGHTEALPVDATRGMRDWSDDVKSLVDTLQLGRFHLVGWSLGGIVGMQYGIDHPNDLLSLTLVNTASPFGFGGTRDEKGTPTYPDFAGSGGGTAASDFVRLIKEGDRSDAPFSARTVMNTTFFKPPFRAAPEREEVYVTSILTSKVGEGFYPGGLTESANWPHIAPGTDGFNNAMSPRYCNLDAFADITAPIPVLWVRGADDAIVSDTSLYDFGFLGQLGAIPGWPGAEVYPPQPMVAQIRYVLDAYQEHGGGYREVVIQDCGHSPHVEKPADFQAALREHLSFAAQQPTLSTTSTTSTTDAAK